MDYEYQKANGFSRLEVDGMSGFVFTNRFGSLHNGQNVNRVIKRICEAYNSEAIEKAKKNHNEHFVAAGFFGTSFETHFCNKIM